MIHVAISPEAAYIDRFPDRLEKGTPPERSVQVDEAVILDYDAQDRLIGVEVLAPDSERVEQRRDGGQEIRRDPENPEEG